VIRVEHLSKRYGDLWALRDVSFRVAEGEIVGFLGPNGAGKTTAMRILTCFMPATAGSVTVAGHDVFSESLEVRRQIGYLPENAPLYPDMRAGEYLRYRARLKGVPRSRREERVGSAMERCRIRDVERRPIGQLSKGYRQRVGLAEALLAEPDILFLDEPTIGLDPGQIRETRKLIRELGEFHTVFLSTHILPEVEMVCSRVIIVNRGHIVAAGTSEELRRQMLGSGTLVLEVKGPGREVQGALETIGGVTRVVRTDHGEIARLRVEAGRDVRDDAFTRIVKNGWIIREMRLEGVSLEDAFVEIVTREE